MEIYLDFFKNWDGKMKLAMNNTCILPTQIMDEEKFNKFDVGFHIGISHKAETYNTCMLLGRDPVAAFTSAVFLGTLVRINNQSLI